MQGSLQAEPATGAPYPTRVPQAAITPTAGRSNEMRARGRRRQSTRTTTPSSAAPRGSTETNRAHDRASDGSDGYGPTLANFPYMTLSME